MRALVVDDSKAMRTIVKRTLEAHGFEVTEAIHGKDAIEQLELIPVPELAMVDWNMPEMNGLEFVELVRGDALYDAMQIVMVTTETESAQMIRALSAGANEYIMKPFTKDIVREKLALLGLVDSGGI